MDRKNFYDVMWRTPESDEYEAAAPAVQAHFHALRAEEALRRGDCVYAEREARLASERFVRAAAAVGTSKRTVDALLLLAENYEFRAKLARVEIGGSLTSSAKDSGRPVANGSGEKGEATPLGAAPELSTSTAATARATAVENVASGGAGHDPAVVAAAESQLNVAAAEMEELWRRLQELGLSGAGSSDKNNVLVSSRHLSSSLGDSFCLLPAKTKSSVGVHGTAIDGESTLRAAVAARMRNQRLRLMEQQYGQRAILDERFHKQQQQRFSVGGGAGPTGGLSPHSGNGIGGQHSYGPDRAGRNAHSEDPHHFSHDRRSSSSSSTSSSTGAQPAGAEVEALQETIAHQKYEIVRLLNTVKTLSAENTKLLKKCDTLTSVQSENRELSESMEKFKTHYNQKLVMIKRALEEWRRQRNSAAAASPPLAASPGPSTPPGPSNLSSAGSAPDPNAHTAALEAKLKLQEQQLAQLAEAVKTKDDQLSKYEKWYKTLKAGAKAKQRSQGGGANGGASPSMSGSDSFGGAVLPRDSFTSSSSFHVHQSGFGYSSSSSSSSVSEDAPNGGGGRPPAHPTRRAL
ncbi:hypothetical protein PybrP1_003893 [[Pythium] brassicae (nom. inval.)]|nr:hypothetical protein PybrP1_003893 [[Pythium] brassicae (nom. inval.)]